MPRTPKAPPAPAPAAKVSTKRAPAKRAPASRVRRRKPTPEYAGEIYDRLIAHYPDAHCALDFSSPFELLVATILSAQCTDKRVNMVTPALFARYRTPAAMAAAKLEELEELIKSTGFFRNKAKSLVGMATAVADAYGGRVPDTMPELVALPGVGRKTANVVLGNAYDKNEGVVVDTHVGRVGFRLALTNHTDPVKVEKDLTALFPRERWTLLSHLLIEHGRQICDARRPKCEICFLNDLCPSSRVRSSTPTPSE